MKNKMISVILVLALIGVAIFVFMPGSGQASMIGDVTVYVKEVDGSEQMQAEVPLDSISGTEQLVMSFGQGIRPMAFTGNLAGIYKTANYEMWASAVMNVKGTGIKAISSTTMLFSGNSGPGTGALPVYNPLTNMGAKAGALSMGASLGDSVVLTSPVAVLNSNTTYDMSSGGKFSRNHWVEGASNKYCYLYGDYLNGATITLSARVAGLGPSNIPVVGYSNVTLNVAVTSFLTASLTLTITSMSLSGNAIVLSMMPAMDMMGDKMAMGKEA